MFHRIKPIADGDRLERIVQFQRKMLTFVCDPATPLSPDEVAIRLSFKEAEDWMWDKLKPRRNGAKSELYGALEQAIKYCHDYPGERKKILDAFDHDIDFHKNLDDPAFQFHYSVQLSTAAQAAIEPLMVAFYTDLLASGYPEKIQGKKKSFTRDEFIKAFFESNNGLNVCPACDGPRPDMVDNKVFADADHFLPKSKYPFLSVHQFNLVPLCLSCNRTFKLGRDPIDDHQKEPLINCFHPYYKPAIDGVDVTYSRDANGDDQVIIREKNGDRSRRVIRMNEVFKLEARWINRMKATKESIVVGLGDLYRLLHRLGVDPKTVNLSQELDEMSKSRAAKASSAQGFVLEASYLRFALADTNELQELLKHFAEP